MTAWHGRGITRFPGIDAEHVRDLDRAGSELLRIGRVEPFHPTGEFQRISRRLAPEALEDVAGEVDRQAGGSRTAVGSFGMIGQRAERRRPVAFHFGFDAVVMEDILELELRTKRLEVDPGSHGHLL